MLDRPSMTARALRVATIVRIASQAVRIERPFQGSRSAFQGAQVPLNEKFHRSADKHSS